MKIVERIMRHPLVVAASLAVAVIGGTWTVFNEVLHKPDRIAIQEKDDKIEELRRQIDNLQSGSTESDRFQTTQQEVQSEEATGKIIRPIQDAKVHFPFLYEVEVSDPQKGLYYYLSIEVEGRQWVETRIPPLPNGGRIEGELAYRRSAFARPGRHTFFLMLFEVKQTEHKKIEQWLQGPDAGGYKINGRLMSRRTISTSLRAF